MLSPYLKFGCLSPARFLEAFNQACAGRSTSQPPVSLLGQVNNISFDFFFILIMDVSLIISCQLLWREFFYMSGVGTPNFDRMEVYIPINILIIVGIE